MVSNCPKCNAHIPVSRFSFRWNYDPFPCPNCQTVIKAKSIKEHPLGLVWYILPPGIDLLYMLIVGICSQPRAEYVFGDAIDREIAVAAIAEKSIPKKDEVFDPTQSDDDPVWQYKVGKCFLEGNGVEQNEKDALSWFLKAAHQGFVDAQSQVGRMYFMGEGTVRNNEEAYFWYSVAVRNGKPQEWADSVARYLKPDQISAVGQRVAEWKPTK